MKTSILRLVSVIALAHANPHIDDIVQHEDEELFLKTPRDIILKPPEPVTEIATTGSNSTTIAPSPADANTKNLNLLSTQHIIGTILMMILITLSNAGGLSGAGSNIPIMLIFFDMGMAEAVPISAFVAVCATVFRFILNFNQPHPNKTDENIAARVSINYEIVSLVMPAVFLGSLFGVMSGPIIGQTAQMIVFGVTVAWSIYTTGKKAR